MKKYHKNALIIKLSPIGGGGNPLSAWVLAYFDVVSDCFDWFLGCFVKFIRHPELVSGSCDVKKGG